MVEIITYEKTPRKPERSFKIRKRPKLVARQENLILRKRRVKNVEASKKAFYRLVASNLEREENPAFFTFTTLCAFDADVAYSYLKPFWSYVKKVYPQVAYIVVPEWQERGAIHFHALVWGIPSKDLRRERSTRILQRYYGRGFLDIRLAYDKSLKMASYMSKYMVKALSNPRLRGKRAYNSSRNALRSVSYPYAQAIDFIEDIIPTGSFLTESFSYETMFLGRCDVKKYNREK